jgi:hypothetical protein
MKIPPQDQYINLHPPLAFILGLILNRPFAVEFGLMSATINKEAAFAYSGVTSQRGTVLEIEVGRIDAGASISFLSQYPGEMEFLMQPLSCLEVLPIMIPTQILPVLLDPPLILESLSPLLSEQVKGEQRIDRTPLGEVHPPCLVICIDAKRSLGQIRSS